MKKDFLDALKERVLVCDGAMGTVLYAKGVYINQCFEALNLSNPSMVKEIHSEYIKAGAEIIETNTFGANRLKLSHFGLEKKLREINEAGVKIAREASQDKVYVAGSIGPLSIDLDATGTSNKELARADFKEQAKALFNAGVDLFIIETIPALNEMYEAIKAIKEITDLPIIAQMTVNEKGLTANGETPEDIVKILEDWGANVVGLNCSVGPVIILDCIEKMRKVSKIYLSAQPNAGIPRKVDGRSIYLCTPEYMAEYAKRMIQVGVNIVGGCCGTTPTHIKAINAAVKALRPVRSHSELEIRMTIPQEELKVIGETERAKKSEFARKIVEGKFVISVEIDPPKGTDYSKVVEGAKLMKENAIDAINIADGPRATARMSPLAMAMIFKNEVGIEPIVHYCCRDRNILGMQSDLLGADALGIRNILIITGDPPKLGDYPDATAVFDVDSIGLVRIASKLNRGYDIAGNQIGGATSFFIGVGANPGAINIDEEIMRFEQKVKAGAEYVLTQPVFDVKLLEDFLKRIEHCRIPVLVGILPLASYRNAEFLNSEVPGMNVPENIMERMRKAGSGAEARAAGTKIAQEALKATKDMVEGVYIMPPLGRYETALKLLEVLK